MIGKEKERKAEDDRKEATNRMNPIQTFIFRANNRHDLEKQKKEPPNIDNAVSKKILRDNIIGKIGRDMNIQKMLIWKKIKKESKRQSVAEMK